MSNPSKGQSGSRLPVSAGSPGGRRVHSACSRERDVEKPTSHPQNNVYSLPYPPREGIYFFDLLLAARCSLEGSGDALVFAMKLNKSNDT